MKLLVTGASGYLGNSFIGEFNKKYEIIGINRTKKEDYYEEIVCDFSKDSVEERLKDLEGDCLIHYACMTDINKCEENKNEALATNVLSTAKLLEICQKNGVKKFIYISTGSVYEKANYLLEEDAPVKSNNFYEATKIMSEEICEYYSSEKLQVAVIRPFFPYGPKTHPKRLINILIQRVKGKKPIFLNNKNKPIITPIFVQDLNKIISEIINKKIDGNFQIYNAAGKEEKNIKEIAEIIGEVVNTTPFYKETGKEVCNFRASSKNISRLTELTPLKEGIRRTIQCAE